MCAALRSTRISSSTYSSAVYQGLVEGRIAYPSFEVSYLENLSTRDVLPVKLVDGRCPRLRSIGDWRRGLVGTTWGFCRFRREQERLAFEGQGEFFKASLPHTLRPLRTMLTLDIERWTCLIPRGPPRLLIAMVPRTLCDNADIKSVLIFTLKITMPN